MDYRAAIQLAHQKLSQSDLGKRSHIQSAFKAIKWTESDDAGSQIAAQLNSQDPNTINLYPALLKLKPEAQSRVILREVGLSLYQKLPEQMKINWEYKLTLPSKGQMDSFQGKLASEEFQTYRELTDSYKTAMDRLVSLNLCNALMANGVPRGQARNLCICQYGATLEYASLKRYHSIKPLVFAYSDRKTCECPGEVFAEYISTGLDNVRESSVGEAFKGLVTDLFLACR